MHGTVESYVGARVMSQDPPVARGDIGQRLLAEQVRLLYARAPITQATVVVNAGLTAWVFQGVAPRAPLVAWLAALCILAGLRVWLVSAYRRSGVPFPEARRWAVRFTAAAGLTGVLWGIAAAICYVPGSLVHQVFLVFVLGGMTAGAASSNASYMPAFVAFAAPALVPVVVRLGAEREPIHAVMAFMLTIFGLAMAGLARAGSHAFAEAFRLRLENEALVGDLTRAQQRLEAVNASLEQRVDERTNEIVEAHAALREADRRKDEFLAVLSHELRNPLAPIGNSLYILERAPAASEHARHARAVIERQVQHLTRLVGDLLDVSRIRSGKVLLQRERIDLREVARRTLDDQRSLYAARRVELRAEEPAEPVWVDADPTRLSQVLTNFLHNAAKYTPERGTVTVAVRREGPSAVLQVADTGGGIAPELLPHIFEPFTQGEQALDRSGGGLGLGLSLVKGLVALHGGEVSARSGGVGHGAEFTVRIPAAPAPDAAPAAEPKLAGSHACRVLIVEDNVDAAESLQHVLELQSHEVAVAFSGPEALGKARAFRPTLILCDIGLPGMDGYELARAFRSDELLRDVPLVAMTGYALSEDRKKAAEAGFDRHLAKPADLAELERVVAELQVRRAG